jgi:hypothetical protein
MHKCAFHCQRPAGLKEEFGLTDGCQFEGRYEGDFIEHDGEWFCPFHAPIVDHRTLNSALLRFEYDQFSRDSVPTLGASYFIRQQGEERNARAAPEAVDHLVRITGTEGIPKKEFYKNAVVAVVPIKGKKGLHCALTAYIGFSELDGSPVIDLTGVHFPSTFAFYQTLHDKVAGEPKSMPPILIDHAVFHAPVSFSLLKIDGPLSAIGAEFKDEAQFSQCTVLGDANFGSATFHDAADFVAFEAKMEASFGFAHFHSQAQFDTARFEVNAEFNGCEFSELASFTNTLFANYLQCEGATFHNDAEFNASIADDARAPIPGDEDYSTASSFPEVVFSDAVFHGGANFANRTFHDSADFRRAVFHRAPSFHNAILHQDTDFGGAQFQDVMSQGAVRAYRALRLSMENARAAKEEADFFALEQRAIRQVAETPFSVRLVSWLYEKTSDYGRSFARPLTFVFQVLLGFWFVMMLCLKPFAAEVSMPVSEFGSVILRFTLEQCARPFAIWSPRYVSAKGGIILEAFNTAPLAMSFASSALSLWFLVLTALFFLALRRRFKLKG